MRILLTGACGRLGTAVRRMAADRHEIVALDCSESVVAIGGIQGDIRDGDTLSRAARGCDAIIHTAAMHSASERTATTRQFIEANVIGTDSVCQVAARQGIRRVVMASSMSIVMGSNAGEFLPVVLDESSPAISGSKYAFSKLLAEQVAQYGARTLGLEVIQLRYMRILDRPATEIGPELLAYSLTADDSALAALCAVIAEGVRDEIIHVGPETPLDQADINRALGVARGQAPAGYAATSEPAPPDPYGVIERHWPGATEVLNRHGYPIRPYHFWPVSRIDAAKRLLGWRPRTTFSTFLRELGWHDGPQANP